MTTETLVTQLSPLELPLTQIYLDPNNPRFVTAQWEAIPDDQIDDSEVQDQTRRRLTRRFDVDKLRMNMEVNGYLTIDRVIVRQFKPNKYVVLEGKSAHMCSATHIAPDDRRHHSVRGGASIHQDNRVPVIHR